MFLTTVSSSYRLTPHFLHPSLPGTKASDYYLAPDAHSTHFTHTQLLRRSTHPHVHFHAQSPDLLIDAATLTGAARVALGPEVPAVFSNDSGVWAEVGETVASMFARIIREPCRHKNACME